MIAKRTDASTYAVAIMIVLLLYGNFALVYFFIHILGMLL